MTTPNDMPPVGATVTDADGMVYECARHIPTRWAKWRTVESCIESDAATDSEHMEERTYLEVRVPNGADLSCRAMVDRAIDAARAAQEGK